MEFKCKNETEEWKGHMEKMIKYKGNIEIFITARSTVIHGIIGQSITGRWICFPERGYGCGLSTLEDTFWNEEKISEGLGTTDAITISQCLKQIAENMNI